MSFSFLQACETRVDDDKMFAAGETASTLKIVCEIHALTKTAQSATVKFFIARNAIKNLSI